jgi:hypothetical protein
MTQSTDEEWTGSVMAVFVKQNEKELVESVFNNKFYKDMKSKAFKGKVYICLVCLGKANDPI